MCDFFLCRNTAYTFGISALGLFLMRSISLMNAFSEFELSCKSWGSSFFWAEVEKYDLRLWKLFLTPYIGMEYHTRAVASWKLWLHCRAIPRVSGKPIKLQAFSKFICFMWKLGLGILILRYSCEFDTKWSVLTNCYSIVTQKYELPSYLQVFQTPTESKGKGSFKPLSFKVSYPRKCFVC